MDTIRQILKEKGPEVFSKSPADTVVEAVKAMCEHRVGAVLVCQDRMPIGVFTERDLMTRIILAERDPHTTTLEQVMTREVVYVDPETSSSEAMAVMTSRHCRHLPVVEEGRLVGLVSIGDLVRWASRTQEFHIRMLTNYIRGEYPA